MKIKLQAYFSQTPRYCHQNYYKITCEARVCKRINSFLHSGQAILSPGCFLWHHFSMHFKQNVVLCRCKLTWSITIPLILI